MRRALVVFRCAPRRSCKSAASQTRSQSFPDRRPLRSIRPPPLAGPSSDPIPPTPFSPASSVRSTWPPLPHPHRSARPQSATRRRVPRLHHRPRSASPVKCTPRPGPRQTLRLRPTHLPRRARRHQEHRVIRRHIAVNGNAVEARIHRCAQKAVERRRMYRRVREQVHEHGCVQSRIRPRGSCCGRHHLRMNHPCAFAHARNAHSLSISLKARVCHLRSRVGGHDCFREADKRFRVERQRAFQRRQRCHQLLAGRGAPIIPVDEGSTSWPWHPNACAAALHTCSAALIRSRPSRSLHSRHSLLPRASVRCSAPDAAAPP